jgi:AcrR family transcriptional regulator
MKKKPVKSSSARDAIADVAVKLFSEHGYTGTTMRDIAQAVGVLPGSLYAHIDSKETLLLEIVRHGIARFLTVEKLMEGHADSPEAWLRAAIRAHVDVVAEDPQRSLVVFHQWRFLGEPNRSSAVAMRRRYANTFVKIIDAGKSRGVFNPQLDTRIAVFTVLGALNWVPEWYSPKGSASAAEIADKLADALIFGLCADPARTRVAGVESPARKLAAAAKGRS